MSRVTEPRDKGRHTMNLVLGTRIALYVQLALGIAQSPGVANDVPGLLHTHRTLAFIIPVLAFLAFGVRPGIPQTTVRTLARFAPLVALLVGLTNWVGFKMMGAIPVEAYWSIMIVHFVWGIAVVAFAEMAAGQASRATRGLQPGAVIDGK
ncbi:MAG: hypothetical protein EBQ56_01450 [Proteobacteria bacterium]|nr:hypothetical protein [Pseudomonadota bacterium]NCV20719.1 hypothetical protein [Chloroflexota bacterium]NBQ32839.1 hypothetical protein [Pseudomonadota bacterium]NBQ61739.1 hypothetical protein [Pseudomonadota bacterium]NBT03983.1 hypothetical protein [Pseudomonadota bacterium]